MCQASFGVIWCWNGRSKVVGSGGGVRDPRIRGIYRAPEAETANAETEAGLQDCRTGRVFAAPSRLGRANWTQRLCIQRRFLADCLSLLFG